MIVRLTEESGKWFGTVYDDDGDILYRSNPERRVGCAARVALNTVEQWHGRPTATIFVMDVSEW